MTEEEKTFFEWSRSPVFKLTNDFLWGFDASSSTLFLKRIVNCTDKYGPEKNSYWNRLLIVYFYLSNDLRDRLDTSIFTFTFDFLDFISVQHLDRYSPVNYTQTVFFCQISSLVIVEMWTCYTFCLKIGTIRWYPGKNQKLFAFRLNMVSRTLYSGF